MQLPYKWSHHMYHSLQSTLDDPTLAFVKLGISDPSLNSAISAQAKNNSKLEIMSCHHNT